MCEIKSEDVYEDFTKDKEIFDFRDYAAKSKYDHCNKLVVGKMIDEMVSAAIEKFVRLKTKINSFLVEDGSEHETAKEVKKCFCNNKS